VVERLRVTERHRFSGRHRRKFAVSEINYLIHLSLINIVKNVSCWLKNIDCKVRC